MALTISARSICETMSNEFCWAIKRFDENFPYPMLMRSGVTDKFLTEHQAFNSRASHLLDRASIASNASAAKVLCSFFYAHQTLVHLRSHSLCITIEETHEI